MKSVPLSIDLRGLDGEEAAMRTDRYLDESSIAGISEVTIIHGVGTGVLKRRISELLRNHPHVKKYRRGEYGRRRYGCYYGGGEVNENIDQFLSCRE